MPSLLYYVFFAYALKLNLQPNKNFKNLETGCLLFHFSNLRNHGWFKFSLSFQWCVVSYKMFSEEKLSQTGQKTANYWCKIFLLKHILRFEYKEKCLSKLSIKIFTKIEARAWKAYSYFWVVGNLQFFQKFTSDNCVRCEAAFVWRNSVFLPDAFNVHC